MMLQENETPSRSPRVVSLCSGSSGNATFIRGECGGGILIDAGVCCKTLTASLGEIGVDIASLDGVFVTHEHTDHTKGLMLLAKKYGIPIHMTRPSADRLRFSTDLPKTLVIHELLYEVDCGPFHIFSFPTHHDSAACVGYVVDDGKSRVGIATDLGVADETVRTSLCGCESVVIESNHDPDSLRFCSYPAELKARILSDNGHLSNPACAELVTYLAANGAKRILLAHISREANTPELALAASQEALTTAGYGDVRLLAAAPFELTVLV